jgi:hypothetical protein
MYSREEASQLRQAFWTAFGQYVAPQPSAEGLKVNWINYKTGIKHLYFRMQADNRTATIAIEFAHPDQGMQELFMEQLIEYKNILNQYLPEEWDWQPNAADEYGKPISRVFTEIKPVSIFKREDWPQLISFFKPRIIALDEFWSDAKYSFDIFK